MRTSQIKSLAGASILSLFLTGCLQANGGVEVPIGSVVSQDKLKGFNAGLVLPPTITLDKQRALSANWFSGDEKTVVFSNDGLRTFKRIKPNIDIDYYFTVFQNKFYTTKNNTAEYYSSMDGRFWTKEGVIENSSRTWSVIRDKTEQNLVFRCWETGERKLIAGVASSIQQPPPSNPRRGAFLKNSKFLIAYDDDEYDGFSISIDGGQTWTNNDNILAAHKGKRCYILLWNETFYFFEQEAKNFYYTSNPFNWNKQLTKHPVLDMICTENEVLCFLFDNNETVIENIFTKKILAKIPTYLRYARYYSNHKIIIVIGGIKNYSKKGEMYIIDGGILTGSGITNFETADNYLAAQFGNGLQMVAYSGNNCPKSFAGKAYTLLGADGDKMKIGRWF